MNGREVSRAVRIVRDAPPALGGASGNTLAFCCAGSVIGGLRISIAPCDLHRGRLIDRCRVGIICGDHLLGSVLCCALLYSTMRASSFLASLSLHVAIVLTSLLGVL